MLLSGNDTDELGVEEITGTRGEPLKITNVENRFLWLRQETCRVVGDTGNQRFQGLFEHTGLIFESFRPSQFSLLEKDGRGGAL